MRKSAATALAVFATLLSAPTTPLSRTFSDGVSTVSVSIEPETARLGETLEAVISVTSPDGVSASLPALSDFDDRFEGFKTLGRYADADGSLHFSLSPVPGAERCRIRPFPVVVAAAAGRKDSPGWFAAGPVNVPLAPQKDVTAKIESNLKPAAIRPSAAKFLRWTGCACIAAALLALLSVLGKKAKKAIAVRRLPPKKRALHELEALLGRDLPSKGRFKDYYSELTLVVRRYIERRHGIKAPRQTTDEFLAAASGKPGFPAETVGRLRDFLSSADLVKFAGASATVAAAAEAAATARAYLDGEPD